MAKILQVGPNREWVDRTPAGGDTKAYTDHFDKLPPEVPEYLADEALVTVGRGAIAPVIPIASDEEAGVVKVGDDFDISEDGVLSINSSAMFISGGVIAFSGTFGGEGNRHPIPRGSSAPDTTWVLCDGGSDGHGGTVPDLRGRMIMGVSSSYTAGSTGGSATHSHTLSGSTSSSSVSVSLSGKTGSATLSTGQTASHSHKIPLYVGVNVATYNGCQGGATRSSGNECYTDSAGSGSGSGGSSSHSHDLSSASVSGGSHSHTNSGSAASTTALPPYYALSYIIKVA